MPEMKTTKVVQYTHRGNRVFARKDLKGKHREHCLCYSCACFSPADIASNCPIANDISHLCTTYGIATPVYECPDFEVK